MSPTPDSPAADGSPRQRPQGPQGPQSSRGPLAERVALALWLAAIITAAAAAFVLLQPPNRGSGGSSGTGGTGSDPGTTDNHSGFDVDKTGMPIVPGIDIKTYIAAPAVPGRPTREEIDAAITKGRDAYLHLYVEPALACAEPGGYLDYTRADGTTTRLGPDVYVQCHLYLIVHLLMYQEELELPKDHPLMQRALHFLVKTFDDATGRWIWSEEGCLHAKGLAALAQFGEHERFEKGWHWALTSPLYKSEDGLFTMMQSGRIVQSLGPATRSLSGEPGWEHGAPLIDEENTAKFLYALFVAGRSPDDPEVAGLSARLSDYLAHNTLAIGFMKTKDLVGRCWQVWEHAHYRLPPDEGYRMALAQLRAAGRGEWRLNFMLRIIPLFRAELIRALLEAGERNAEIDAMVNGIVKAQEPDGAWRVPHTKPLWGIDPPPKVGYKFGNIDGANTYAVTVTLIHWRRAIYGEE